MGAGPQLGGKHPGMWAADTRLPAHAKFKCYQLASHLHISINKCSILVIKENFEERKHGQNQNIGYVSRSRRGVTNREEVDETGRPKALKTSCLIFPRSWPR